MRSLFLSLLVSATGYASGPFSHKDYSDVCSGARVVDSGYKLVCFGARRSADVRSARVGPNARPPKKVSQGFLDHLALDLLPDADTNVIYGYTRKLLDRNDRVVGYLSIDGYHNTEMEVKLQVNTRYNNDGQLVSAEVK